MRRERWELFWSVARRSFAAQPISAGVVVFILVAKAASIPTLALAQRWLVDGVASTAGVVVAALLGAVAYAAIAAGNRIQSNLRSEIADRIELTLDADVLMTSSSIPTIDFLEDAEFLDRSSLAQRGTGAIAASFWTALETLVTVLALGLSVVLLASVHWSLVLVAGLCVPPLLTSRWTREIVVNAMAATASDLRRERAYHDLCTSAGPAKELRIAGNASRLDVAAASLWTQASRRELRARVRAYLMQLLGWASTALGFGFAVSVVTIRAANGEATLGEIVMVVALCVRMRAQVAHTVSMVSESTQSASAAGHLLWLRSYAARSSTANAGTPPPEELSEGLELDRVSYTYPGSDRPVLQDISVSLPAGSIVGLVGLNGAGKTTLVDLLTGMRTPTSGSITVDGADLGVADASGWKSRSAVVFQDFLKLELTLRESVGVGDLPRVDDDAAVGAALRESGAEEVRVARGLDLNSQLGSSFGGADLSHGQWQRLALARCLMRDRPLVLAFDEPSAALDPDAEHAVFGQIAQLARTASGRAVTVLVSHRFSTVSMTDLVVVLEHGRVVEVGPHRELLRTGGVYAEMYAAQAAAHA